MFRIAALNDSDTGDDNTTTSQHAATTKEAKEAEAFSLYSRALSLQREGDVHGAEKTFKNLISHDFLVEAARLVDEDNDNVVHPGLQLLYSIHKNLAAIAAERGDLHTAMKSYLEAVKIDWSEVTVWYKIGTIGLKIHDYSLSRLAFEQGLQCNPNHWPCLDNLITVSYALNDYWRCLYYIAKALEKDYNYEKGIALRDAMFHEQPSLRQDSKDMFVYCDPVALTMKLEKEDADEYVEEALAMRRKKRELAQKPPPKVIKFPEKIKSNTWKAVGEALIALYNHARQSSPPISMSRRVDMSEYEVQSSDNNEPNKSSSVNNETAQPVLASDEQVKDKEVNMETDEPADVVDGDIKPKTEENQKEDAVKEKSKSPKESVTVASEEVLDEDNGTVIVKSESSDFQTKDVAAFAQDVIDTPCKITIKEDGKLDVNGLKMETEEGMDDDGGVYPISAGLDLSPGQSDSLSGVELVEEVVTSQTTTVVSTASALSSASKPCEGTPGLSMASVAPQTAIDSQASEISTTVAQTSSASQDLEINTSAAMQTVMSASSTSSTVTNVMSSVSMSSLPVAETPEVMSSSDTPIIRGMLGYPPVSSVCAKTDESCYSSSIGTHPLVAAQLISTPKSSILLSTSMPPVTSSLGISVPNTTSKMQSPPLTPGLLSPVTGTTPPRVDLAPDTPDILHRNPFMKSPPSRTIEAAASRSQSLLSIALTQPTVPSLSYPMLIGSGDAPPKLPEPHIPSQSSPSTKKNLLSPSHTTSYTYALNNSPVQTVPLQSNMAKQLSPVQGLLTPTTPVSSHIPISQQLSPEESQLIAQHAAAQTLIALAQMPTQLSPERKTSPGGTLTTTSTLAGLMSGGVMKQATDTSLASLSYPLPPEVALQDHPNPISRNQGLSRRGAKRKRVTMPIEDAGMKRRSARVRNTSRKKQEDSINMQELLYKFLPSTLIQASDDDEESRMDETDVSLTAAETTTNLTRRPSEGAPLDTCEETEVKEFVQKCIKNNGIIDLLFRFLTTLADKYNMKWPEDLGEVYVQVYDKLRPHIVFPCVLGSDESMTEDDIREYGRICLLWAELKLDQWLSTHSKPVGTPSRGGVDTILGEVRNGEDLKREDLWYLMTLAGSKFLLQDNWMEFAARVYWMKARLSMIQSDKHEADYCFDKLSYVMDCAKEEKDIGSFKLQNCKVDDIISKDQVNVQQESLQRSQSLEETQKLYEAGNYDKVVELLLQTFSQPQTAKKISEMGDSLPERHSQLMLLQDSLFKLKDYKKCLLWGEVSFNEALQQYRRASGQCREDWLSTIRQIFEHTNKVLDKDDSILKSLPSSNTVRLSQNLIRMIELTMDSSDSSNEVPNTVVLSWILLSRLIKSEEAKLRSMLVAGEEGGGMDGAISSSVMLLNVAHEYLGRQSWCTKSNGALLLYFLKELEGEMKKPHFTREGLDMALEQCIYCLYGHPNKKGKAKHLQDHNAPVITLDWDKAGIVFDYFKPNTVPEFDSYKANTVSTELENLLRRLFLLVPNDVSSAKNNDAVQNYIEGNTNTAPSFQTESSVLLEMYYLLADYYFKNKETSKAIKFYTHDICVNPNRLDSWAGLALARMSQLEQKLSSMELKMDNPIHKKSIAALRCFRRAVEIDETQRKLWIEYGSLAYQLHSHASRQLKMQDWFPLNEELLGIVTDTKQEMLQVAHNCYWKASECEADGSEEEWLHHYMIGKVKEKKRCHPRDYLEHYRQAAIYLHEDEAFYPKKITYASSPPKLALEALEVFYRLHVVMLKQLLKKEGGMVDYELFQHYLTEAADSPFARGKEKRHERRESQSASLDESSSSNLTPPAYSQLKARPVYHMTPQDHTYSKQKSSVDGSDMSCDAVKDSQGGESSQSKSLPGSNRNKHKKSEGQKSDSEKSDNCEKKNDKSEPMEVTSEAAPVSLQKHDSTGFVPKLAEEESKDTVKDKASHSEIMNNSSDLQQDKNGTDSTKSDCTKQSSDENKVTSSLDNKTSEQEKNTSDHVSTSTVVSSSGVKISFDSENVTSAPDNSSTDWKRESDSVMVLDPATGLLVPASKEDEDMDMYDPIPVLIEDSSLEEINTDIKNSDKSDVHVKSDNTDKPDKDIKSDKDAKSVNSVKSDVKEKDKPVESSKSTPVVSSSTSETAAAKTKDVEVIEISDDEALMPVKNKLSLSLKDPNQPKKETEISVSEIKKQLFDSDKDKSKSKDVSQPESSKSGESENQSKERKDSVPESESSLISDNSDDSDSASEGDQHDSMDREILHTELLDKCIDGLLLCVQRFPTHYKSLYRLAHVYMTSPYHKNVEYARDLLLGNPNWQNLSHMPGPGLFAERKSTNFFQGIWKIPIEEIDRSGSFATHILRSVRLLLEILKEQRDIQTLLQVHQQLNRSPDTGKKYLRDQERNHLAKSSFKFILEAIHQELKQWDKKKPRSEQLDFLMSVYRVWYHANHKLNAFVDQMREQLVKVFKLVQRDTLDPNLPLFEQATRFCQSRAAAARAASQGSESNKSLNTSGFMSPPSNKGPTTSANTPSSTAGPQLTSPKQSQGGLFSPSPKKMQSPFSSPSGQSGHSPKVTVHLDGSKLQTGQSDGSKVSTSQSDASSVSGASQSEGDDALVFTSPVSLTSAVQSRLLSVDAPNPYLPRGIPTTGSQTHPLSEHTSPMMQLFDQPPFVRPYDLPAYLHMPLSPSHPPCTPWSSVYDPTHIFDPAEKGRLNTHPVNLTKSSNTKFKPRHPIASSINLKSVADGMKKKLKTALLASPRLLSAQRSEVKKSAKSYCSLIKPTPKRAWDASIKIIPSHTVTSNSGPEKNSSFEERRSPESAPPRQGDNLDESEKTQPNPPLKKQKLISLLSQTVHEVDREIIEDQKSEKKEKILPLESNVFSDYQPSELTTNVLTSTFSPILDILDTSSFKFEDVPNTDLGSEVKIERKEETKVTPLCDDVTPCLGLPQSVPESPIEVTSLNSSADILGLTDCPEQESSSPVTSSQIEEIDLETMIPTLQIRIPATENKLSLTGGGIPEQSSSLSMKKSYPTIEKSAQLLLKCPKSEPKVAEVVSSPSLDIYSFSEHEFSNDGINPSEFSRLRFRSSSFGRFSRLGSQSHSEVGTDATGHEDKPAEYKHSESDKLQAPKDNQEVTSPTGISEVSPPSSTSVIASSSTLRPTDGQRADADAATDGVSVGECRESSDVPMEDIIPSVTPGQIPFATFTSDLYEFISSDEDTDEHALTIDMEK